MSQIQMNKSNQKFLSYDLCDINDPLLSEQLKEINETEETKSKALQALCRDLKNLKDIEPCLEEDFLLSFLRVSKYDTAKALQRVLKYYQTFEVYLDTYKKFSFPLHEAETICNLTISPFRCQNNSFLIFGKGAIDYKRYTFGHAFWLEIVGLSQLLENPVNQICGGTYIFDYEGMGIQGLLARTPFWVRLFVDSLLNAFPCRLKAVHIVNMPSFYPLLVKIVYPFLPKKIQDRIFFHGKKGDWKNLHSLIPTDILPEKYGGKLKNSELINASKNLKEQEEKFLRLFAFGYIKTKNARQSMKVLK